MSIAPNESPKAKSPSSLPKCSTETILVHLRPGLKDRDFRVRAEAVQAFSNHPDAARAVPDLIPPLGEVGIGAKSAVPQLLLRLKDPDRLVRGDHGISPSDGR